MHRRCLPALLAALLGACADRPPATAPQAMCERQADSDPQVRLLNDRALGNPDLMVNLKPDIAYARKQAETACLRRLGLAPKGGVEPLKP